MVLRQGKFCIKEGSNLFVVEVRFEKGWFKFSVELLDVTVESDDIVNIRG